MTMENEVLEKEVIVEKQPEVISGVKTESKPAASWWMFLVPKMSQKAALILVLVIAIVALGGYVAFAKKSWFVAAIVNGSPISRLSVVEELEKRGGKDVLDAMITKKLLADETKRLGVVVKSEDIDAEMKKVEDQIAQQGATLDEALAQQGMTLEDLRDQILINKELEQILADKTVVSDADVDQYIKDNKSVPAKGVAVADFREQIRQQLQSQKFSTEAQNLVTSLRTKASIMRYVAY